MRQTSWFLRRLKKNYYRKRCPFYIAELIGREERREIDHDLIWMGSEADPAAVTESKCLSEVLETYFQRVNERLSVPRAARRRTLFSIFHNANAMTLSWVSMKWDRGDKVVSWRDVVKVEAFKRDLYAVDLICLSFLFEDNKSIEIDEEMEGWDSLVNKLSEYLPGSQKFADWFERVAFPAFKTNLTVIYRRGESPRNPRQSAVLTIF